MPPAGFERMLMDPAAIFAWLKDFLSTPTGVAIAGIALAFVSKRFPVIGDLLTKLFDQFFRPPSAAAPPGCVKCDGANVLGPPSMAVPPAVSDAATAFQSVVNYLRSNGMPAEMAQKILADTAPYWIHADASQG